MTTATTIRPAVWSACEQALHLGIAPLPGLFGHVLAQQQAVVLAKATPAEIESLVLHLFELQPQAFIGALELVCDVVPLAATPADSRPAYPDIPRRYGGKVLRPETYAFQQRFERSVEGGLKLLQALQAAGSREVLAHQQNVRPGVISRRVRSILCHHHDEAALQPLAEIAAGWV